MKGDTLLESMMHVATNVPDAARLPESLNTMIIKDKKNILEEEQGERNN